MLSPDTTRRTLLAATAGAIFLGAGCVSRPRVPDIVFGGSRAREFTSLSDLAHSSCALAVVTPTGKFHPVPLEDAEPDSAPIPFCEMKVSQVVAGRFDRTSALVVSIGKDRKTQTEAFLDGGPFLVFLAPAITLPGRQFADGYVAVGGPAGAYVSDGTDYRFLKIDKDSPKLPDVVDTRSRSAFSTGYKTEQQILAEGPDW